MFFFYIPDIRDAEIFLDKQVKLKDVKNNARPNNKICSNISWFMQFRMKLCQSKQADQPFSGFFFSASLLIYLLLTYNKRMHKFSFPATYPNLSLKNANTVYSFEFAQSYFRAMKTQDWITQSWIRPLFNFLI